ncbi:hypothetical protein BYT27DRAFT_7076296, partial [Phlegmacium glaucopus]
LNVHVDTVDTATFFTSAHLPDPLMFPATPGTLGQSDRLFFHYMKDTVKGEESVDFTSFILGMFQYDEPYINERSYPSLCAVCRFNCPGFVVLTAWILIAEAISAFYHNDLRCKLAGYPMVKSQAIPGITMVGGVPIFYPRRP